MAQDEADQSVALGQGAKLAGFVVIVAAAFAMGFSTASRGNASQGGQADERLDDVNRALFHSMMASEHQTASAATDEAAWAAGDEPGSVPARQVTSAAPER